MGALLAFAPLAASPGMAMACFSVAACGGGGIYVLVTADMLGRVPLGSTSSAGGMTAAAQSLAHIIAAELEPKPAPGTYDRFLKLHDVDAGKAAMFEDLARNLAVPHSLGMTTVLVVPEHTREVFREGWELEGRDAPHVDHVTDDLVGFLQAIPPIRP